jgi:hypothetical protein
VVWSKKFFQNCYFCFQLPSVLVENRLKTMLFYWLYCSFIYDRTLNRSNQKTALAGKMPRIYRTTAFLLIPLFGIAKILVDGTEALKGERNSQFIIGTAYCAERIIWVEIDYEKWSNYGGN